MSYSTAQSKRHLAIQLSGLVIFTYSESRWGTSDVLFRHIKIQNVVGEILRNNECFENMYPEFSSRLARQIPEGWRFSMKGDQRASPEDTFELRLDHDGSSRLFFGRIAAVRDSSGSLAVFPEIVRDIVLRYLILLGKVYTGIGFWGQVDLGVAVTGIRGAWPSHTSHSGIAFAGDCARNTARASASNLIGQHYQVAQDLLFQFCHGLAIPQARLFGG